MMKPTFLSILFLLCFCASMTVARVGRSQDLSIAQVQSAIDGGVNFLRAQQMQDGSWPDYLGYTGGKTALCTLALLSCGVPADDRAIVSALANLRTIEPNRTYVVGLQTMVFCAATPIQDRKLIERNVQWLIKSQLKSGQRPGTWTYDVSHGNGDNSNTQFALLALHEASRIGVKIPPEVWAHALQHWRTTQNEDGSWKYYPDARLPGTGSMTCAGLASMIILTEKMTGQDAAIENGKVVCCRQKGASGDLRQIERGIQWLADHFSVTHNPGDNRLMYYLYALERVGRMSGWRFIGSHDWYREGTDHLIRLKGALYNQRQMVDFWYGEDAEERDKIISTCYALLFLSKGRRPVLISKLQYGASEDWNTHRQDIKNLTAYVETQWKQEMTWQYVDIYAATVDDLLLSPILYLCGTNNPLPSQEKKRREIAQKLRDYLDRGGFIIAEGICGGAGFDTGVRQLVQLMFPGDSTGLQPLPPDHPIWRAEKAIAPDQIRPIYGVSFGCRTSFIYLPQDSVRAGLSCLWEAQPYLRRANPIPESAAEQIQGGLDLGLNIAAYATNREVKAKDEIIANQTRSEAGNPMRRGRLYVANVRHPGGCQSAPRALENLLTTAAKQLGLRTGVEQRQVALSDSALYEYPILFMHGRNAFRLTEQERNRLKTYLDRGGVLFVNSICSSEEFSRSFEALVSQMYPDKKMAMIPGNDPVWSSAFGGFDLPSVEIRTVAKTGAAGTASAGGAAANTRAPVRVKAITLDGRYAIFFSPLDISCALEGYGSQECSGYSVADAAKIGLNVLLYAVQK